MSDATVAFIIPPVLIGLSALVVILVTQYQDKQSAAVEAQRKARASLAGE